MSTNDLDPSPRNRLHRFAPCLFGKCKNDLVLADTCATPPPILPNEWLISEMPVGNPHWSELDLSIVDSSLDAQEIGLTYMRGFIAPAGVRTLAAVRGIICSLSVADLDPTAKVMIARKVTLPSLECPSYLETSHHANEELVLKKAVPLNVDTGYLLGVAVGNGWCSRQQGLFIGDNSEELAAATEECLHSVFEDTSRKPMRSTLARSGMVGDTAAISTEHVWYSNALGRFVEGQIGRGAESKHLPPIFWGAPREFLLGLLAGLMATDGTFWESEGKIQMSYSTTSLRLAREILVLCSRLNLRANLSANDHSTRVLSGLREYSVVMSPGTFVQIAPYLRLHKFEKTELLARNRQSRPFRDAVPFSKVLSEEVLKKTSSRSERLSISFAARQGRMERPVARKWLRLLEPFDDSMLELTKWRQVIEDESIAWEILHSRADSKDLKWWPQTNTADFLLSAGGYMFTSMPLA